MKNGAEVRQVTHLQTKKWADLTAPEDTKIMLDMVQAIRAISHAKDSPEPILIHCSAGVGRTGTFIASTKLYFSLFLLLENQNKHLAILPWLPLKLMMKQKQVFIFLRKI